jgi:DNA-(apurinic or apyrimidinic site) lyase
MKKFCDDLATHMEQPPTAKTICFTVKMMGYAARIVGSHFVAYPPSVSIPVDSRLTTIYNFFHPSDKQSNQRHIQQRFDHHAKHCGVPPLHFDSLIRCDFWQRYFLS